MNEEQELEEILSEEEIFSEEGASYEEELDDMEEPDGDYEEDMEADADKEKKEDKRRRFWDEAVWYAKVFLCAAILALAVHFLTPIIFIKGDSMNNTLYNRELCIGCTFIGVSRGDIIIFKNEDTYNSIYVKRIIGEPGDTVEIQGDSVYINGELLDEPYAYFSDDGTHYPYQDISVTLGDDEYFVCGDNRYNSRDSRIFGTIKKEDIQASVIFQLDLRWLTGLWGN